MSYVWCEEGTLLPYLYHIQTVLCIVTVHTAHQLTIHISLHCSTSNPHCINSGGQTWYLRQPQTLCGHCSDVPLTGLDDGQTDREQIRSRIHNNWCSTFWPHRPLSTAYKQFCMPLTKAYVAKASCISCYWFCYVSAHDQFARYWQCSNEPLRHQDLMSCVAVHSSGCVSDHITFHSNMFTSRPGMDLACVLISLLIFGIKKCNITQLMN